MELAELIEQEFTLDPEVMYLNHAAVAPWPVRTSQAVQKFAQQNQHRGAQFYPDWMKTEAEVRRQLKRLINAPASEDIALLKNTSEALSFVAYGLKWQAGDNIVISNQEFPSNQIVWQSLKTMGVEIREVDLDSANTPEDALLSALDPHTRLLSISSVQYATGLRIQLERLGETCKKKHVLFCVDAIQSIGALDFDVQAIQADFVMADGHKWMLAPEGVALFYCQEELRERLSLNEYGWHMVEHIGDYTRSSWEPAHSARRFECGSPNMLGIHALHASLSLLLEIGIPVIEQTLLRKSRLLIDEVNHYAELELITDPQPDRLAGIVTFRHRSLDPQALYEHLMALGVICACRGGGVRFSPHFYTADETLCRAVELAALSA